MARHLKDGSESDKKTFSLRIPHSLAAQIDARATLNRRNRNAEIQYMLEQYIDLAVAKDEKLLKDFKSQG